MVKPAGSRQRASAKRTTVDRGGNTEAVANARLTGSADGNADRDAATRDRILAAAHRVFLRHGTAKARTQEIADEAGVNKALVHYYFGTKDALADAVFAAAAGALMPRIFAILADPSKSIEEKVRAVVREQLDFHGDRPYLAVYVVSEAHTHPHRVQAVMRTAGAAPVGALRKQLAAAAAAGEIRRISAEQFVVNLMGLLVFPFVVRPVLETLLGLDAERFPAFIEARKRELPAFFLAGLRP